MTKKTTGKKNKKKTQKKQSKKQQAFLGEVIGFLIIGCALLVLASVFTDQVGIVGEGIETLFVGFFGIGGYLLPFFAIYLAMLYMKGYLNRLYENLRLMIPFMLLLMTLFHLLYYGGQKSYELLSLDYINYASWYNGGWIGGALGHMSLTLFGTIGSLIVLIIMLGIWTIIVTQFPILSVTADLFKKGYHHIKSAFQSYHESKKRAIEKRIKTKTKEKEEAFSHPPIYVGGEGEPLYVEETVYDEQPPCEAPKVSAVQTEKESKEKPVLEITQKPYEGDYEFPSIELLRKNDGAGQGKGVSRASLNNAQKLEATLGSFGVEAKVLQIHKGPTVTRYELQPKQGVKVSKIVNLADDIALNLAASGIRIEAPIPGKAAVGIEVPNEKSEMVYLRDVLESDQFIAFPSPLAFALGKDIGGKPIVADIGKMPHILIAGATGSGKSVCINTLITSILYKSRPNEVKLIMIDPKVVELNVYNGIPHLMIPVVTDPRKAAGALCWAVNEMTKRYNAFAENNVRDMTGFNQKVESEEEKMPHIVIIIDELADLMMTAAKEVEDAICRLAQMARAAGIHLVIATQRPSVDVITGVIKANIPSRLAFAVSSGIDSRTILDTNGAEKLLGKGDMLFSPIGASKPIRIQGAFVSDQEVEAIVDFVKAQSGPVQYEEEVIESIETPSVAIDGQEEDELVIQAINLAKGKEKMSISMLQRYFRIGFNRASRLMDSLEARGIVGPDEGSKPRKVLQNKMEERDYE